MVRHMLAGILALGVLAAPAFATTQQEINATLRNDAELWDKLFVLALADQIRLNCPTIEPRTLRATRYVYDVYSHARSYGFSRAEIRAFQTNEDARAELRVRVLAYFNQHGVREGAPETFCALGNAEISAGTPAGTLLRVR